VVRRTWLVILSLCCACDLSVHGDDNRSGRPRVPLAVTSRRDPGTLVVGRPTDAQSLDPARVSDNESAEVCEQIYESLLTYNGNTKRIEPGLAEKWEMSTDGRVWTFHLRKGVRFHDGSALDAAAVVFSLDRVRDSRHPFHIADRSGLSFVYWENVFRDMRRVEAIDPLTVRITIDRLNAPFEANMAMFPVAIVSPGEVAKWGVDYYRHPSGTGPFKFVRWDHGRIVLARNDQYWGKHPEIERLVFRAVPDARQRLIELESAALDVAYSIPPDQLQFVELLPDLLVKQVPSLSVAYLAMNTTHPPFDDVRVRRAVNHAVNRDPIVMLAYQGLASPATGPLPPEQWGYHESQTTYPYDPERARALLAQAAADRRFDPARVLRLYAPSTPRPYLPEPQVIARVLQANLAAVGIKTELVIQDKERHQVSTENGEHDMCLFGWVSDNGDPDNFLYTLLDQDNARPGLAENLAFFRDDELHRLLLSAQRVTARGRREELYRRAQERIALEAPWVPLAHSRTAVAARVNVEGLTINPTSGVEFKGVRRLAR
jgi:peptide/nickel transport system substrate-binding protein